MKLSQIANYGLMRDSRSFNFEAWGIQYWSSLKFKSKCVAKREVESTSVYKAEPFGNVRLLLRENRCYRIQAQ